MLILGHTISLQVKKLEAILENKGDEIKRLENEMQKLRNQATSTLDESASNKPFKMKASSFKAKPSKKIKALVRPILLCVDEWSRS